MPKSRHLTRRHFAAALATSTAAAPALIGQQNAQPPATIFARIGKLMQLVDIAHGNQSHKPAVVVNQQEFFDLGLVENPLGLIERGIGVRRDEILPGHHIADATRIILLKFEIPPRHNANEARAFLVQTSMTMNELLSLQVGNIITTEKAASRDVLIQVEGKNKFLGQVGQLRGSKAVRITRRCHENDEAVAGAGR